MPKHYLAELGSGKRHMQMHFAIVKTWPATVLKQTRTLLQNLTDDANA